MPDARWKHFHNPRAGINHVSWSAGRAGVSPAEGDEEAASPSPSSWLVSNYRPLMEQVAAGTGCGWVWGNGP